MIEIRVKFPAGMSDRDKSVIKQEFLESCQLDPPQTEQQAYDRFHAFVGEWYTFLGVRRHNRGKGFKP